ncbi:actin [Heterostelium album PN500]|uniref:Actin n=1 Tax=Heterostelium pallidum (strain ATCC 26659 / Pp 5 / PN500) TaxID=670386 RepID=D3BP94_HETP5|nr:actin [Heterostelium album PN500]EFA77104.1 actin [Heterostelium album PN500]|eukprot:XP_020429233.1 actin [Heterostelium album PN500]
MNPTIVIDCGSSLTKSGIAGESFPKYVFPTLIGKHVDEPMKTYVGEDVNVNDDQMAVIVPIKNGRVSDLFGVEQLFGDIFFNKLKVSPSECSLLITEPSIINKSHREKMISIAFDVFQVSSIHIGKQTSLSLYPTGLSNGLVVDCGHDISQVVPIFNGNPIDYSILNSNFGGGILNERLDKLLSFKGLKLSTKSICDLKENLESSHKYTLPDGKTISLGGNELTNGLDDLLQPSFMGIETATVESLIEESISSCGEELQNELFGNIVLSGGTTMMNGFKDHLENKLQSTVTGKTKIRIFEHPARGYLSWLGGSMLSSSSGFVKNHFVSKSQYDEYGLSIFN